MNSTSPAIDFRETQPIAIDGKPDGVGFPGTDSIGLGYDIFGGQFAHPESTKRSLFDLGAPVQYDTPEGAYFKPETVRVQWLEDAKIVATSGTQTSDYQSDMAAQVGLTGGFGFFSGSLNAQFTETQRRCTAFNFVTQTDQYHIAVLTLEPDGSLRALLRDRVANDLEALEPEVLFDTYGTHYLHSLIVGASATYSAATNIIKYRSSTEYTQAAEISYRGLTGQLSASEESRYAETIDQFRASSTVKVHAQGGRAELAGKIVDGKYEEWRDSVREHMAFVSLNSECLRPLWALCSDDTRRKTLAKAYESYAPTRENDPVIVPIYAYHSTGNPARWYYSIKSDEQPQWDLEDEIPFYAAKTSTPERVPVYLHAASEPDRYKLSTSDEVEDPVFSKARTAFWAYDEQAPNRVPVYEFKLDIPTPFSFFGWRYSTKREVDGWVNVGVAFYTDKIE